jgi:hypothetical protein
MLLGREMGSSSDGDILALFGPWQVAHGDWYSALSVLMQKARRWMRKSRDLSVHVARVPPFLYAGIPGRRMFKITSNIRY